MNHTKWTAARMACARVHVTVWAVHDTTHRAVVTLVPPALLAIFDVDTHPWIDHRAGYKPRRDAEDGRWGKAKVCEGDKSGMTRWKEMSLAWVSARVEVVAERSSEVRGVSKLLRLKTGSLVRKSHHR